MGRHYDLGELCVRKTFYLQLFPGPISAMTTPSSVGSSSIATSHWGTYRDYWNLEEIISEEEKIPVFFFSCPSLRVKRFRVAEQ